MRTPIHRTRQVGMHTQRANLHTTPRAQAQAVAHATHCDVVAQNRTSRTLRAM